MMSNSKTSFTWFTHLNILNHKGSLFKDVLESWIILKRTTINNRSFLGHFSETNFCLMCHFVSVHNLIMFVFTFHRAISHMMSSLLYPLITFVLLLVCVAYWGATALYPFSFHVHVMLVCRLVITLHIICRHRLLFKCYSTTTSTAQSIGSSLNKMYIDIWQLQAAQSTKWWLSTPL